MCVAQGATSVGSMAGANRYRRRMQENVPSDYQSRSLSLCDMLPDNASAYTYSGSLMTPPCSEVVFLECRGQAHFHFRTRISRTRLANLLLGHIDPSSCEPDSNAAPSGFTGRSVQRINGRPIQRIWPSDHQEEKRKEVVSSPTDDDTSTTPQNEKDDEEPNLVQGSASGAVCVSLLYLGAGLFGHAAISYHHKLQGMRALESTAETVHGLFLHLSKIPFLCEWSRMVVTEGVPRRAHTR
jgi:hypothetical protein